MREDNFGLAQTRNEPVSSIPLLERAELVTPTDSNEQRASEQRNLQQQSRENYTLWSSDLPGARLEKTFSTREELQAYLEENKIYIIDTHSSGGVDWHHLIGHKGVVVQGNIHPTRSFQLSSEFEIEGELENQLPTVNVEGELAVQAPLSPQTTGYADIGVEYSPLEGASEAHGSVAVSQGTGSVFSPYIGASSHLAFEEHEEEGHEEERHSAQASASLLLGSEISPLEVGATNIKVNTGVMVPLSNTEQSVTPYIGAQTTSPIGSGRSTFRTRSFLSDQGGFIEGTLQPDPRFQATLAYSSYNEELAEQLPHNGLPPQGISIEGEYRIRDSASSPIVSLGASQHADDFTIQAGLRVPLGRTYVHSPLPVGHREMLYYEQARRETPDFEMVIAVEQPDGSVTKPKESEKLLLENVRVQFSENGVFYPIGLNHDETLVYYINSRGDKVLLSEEASKLILERLKN
jgi:hypothetical protein